MEMYDGLLCSSLDIMQYFSNRDFGKVSHSKNQFFLQSQ